MQFPEHNIFFEEKASTGLHDNEIKSEGNLQSNSIPYLKKGDSNIYLEQFLAKEEEPLEIEIINKVQIPPERQSEVREDVNSEEPDESFTVSGGSRFNPSAFHNFQKHLTVCIKSAIHITPPAECPGHVMLAIRLWRAFQATSIATKKVLHYLLGEKNEHEITEKGLKECRLHQIYEAHDEEMLREARLFLAAETLQQIRDGKLNDYIQAKKLKNKEKFKKYVGIFVEELENGYLRKRLPRDKVNYLIRA